MDECSVEINSHPSCVCYHAITQHNGLLLCSTSNLYRDFMAKSIKIKQPRDLIGRRCRTQRVRNLRHYDPSTLPNSPVEAPKCKPTWRFVPSCGTSLRWGTGKAMTSRSARLGPPQSGLRLLRCGVPNMKSKLDSRSPSGMTRLLYSAIPPLHRRAGINGGPPKHPANSLSVP